MAVSPMRKSDRAQPAYEALVTYHHTLVQSRFSAVALYMAAASFLVAAHLADTSTWKGHAILIPLLGLATTLAVWFLELRTEALLANVARRGVQIESDLGLGNDEGFFKLMAMPQPLGVRVPFLRTRVPNSGSAVRYFTSHTLWLEVIYLSFLCFWVNAIWVAA